MGITKFEKFEMKYGYILPEDFKAFMYKHGGDVQYGSCRFDYPSNIINNLIRIPGYMDFHIVPFGDIGNGDYYGFFRYGFNACDYFVGIWLHETSNFVILCSSFRSFIYKCLLDDYLSTIVPDDDFDGGSESYEIESETMQRCISISEEFDLNKVKTMKNEYDYHRLMIEFDNDSLQSLCYIGKQLLKENNIRGLDILNMAIKKYPYYTAPYYIAGKFLNDIGKDGSAYFKRALKTSLVTTGYSYWEEDFLEIPEDVHREIELYVDEYLKDSISYIDKRFYSGEDPYSFKLRMDMARKYFLENNFENAVIELNNSIFCTDNIDEKREALKESIDMCKDAGYYYLAGIAEHDLRNIK